MKKLNVRWIICLLLVISGLFMSYYPLTPAKNDSIKELPQLKTLESAFRTVPDSIQTSVYWYWISDNLSKAGVIKDLQAMKKAGINRAFIGNIGLDDVPYGKVKIFSDQWWDILHAALKTATKLNIEIGIFNSPGWSQSGGPWIKPEESMRYLCASKVVVEGGQTIDLKLKRPVGSGNSFQDVRVLAMPAPKDFNKTLRELGATVTTIPGISNDTYLTDGDTSRGVSFKKDSIFTIDVKFREPLTARSVVLYPAKHTMVLQGVVQAMINGAYKTIKSFRVDRSNDALNVGFLPYAPGAISVPATTANEFRIKFDQVSENSGLNELKISATPVVEDYAEKSLAKMFPTPFPYWTAYQWAVQPTVNDKTKLIDPAKVVDVTRFMQPDGRFKWEAPKGSWIIMRTGMVPTGVKNGPAAPEGTGLEVDKMSKKHVRAHFDAFLGQILKRIPASDRKTFKVTVEDSYETGGQNWTDGLITKFKKAFGYDPTPYLPVLQGLVVGSEDRADRFLWDMRRFIAHEVAYQYVAGLREVSHEHGLHTWLENYGHWGFPGEFLQYGGQSDEVGGEFWSEGDLGNIENRAASSAAHIYGKTKVSAESFTAGGR
ncbi:MAG TPA: glycosyl hydrolase, partial [Arachidicoccus sp.]|nr:glycosyl hydrolase [Arachidicoccus sp.]